MATSGSFSGGIFSNISWTAWQNKDDNYSVVTTTLTVGGSSYELTKRGGTNVTLTVNGFAKSGTFYGPGQTLTSKSTVYHNADGSAQFKITASYSNYGEDQSGSISRWFTLNTIPRGALIETAPASFTDEDSPVITYKYQAGDSAHSIEAVIATNTDINNLESLITHTLSKTSSAEAQTYTFALTEAERDILRLNCNTANSKKLYLGIRTVIGGSTFFSNKETTFSVINATPTVVGSVVDVNPVSLALTGDASTLIRFVSSAKASMSVAVFKQAAIKSYQIEHNANIFPVLEQTFEQVEGNAFGFKLTDSRGNTVEDFILSPMIDYTRLTCNMAQERPNALGEMLVKCSGNYFNDTFGFSDVAIQNTLQVQYRYKEQNGEYTPWVNIPFAINENNTYDASFTLTGLDYTKTYVFQCRAIDKLLTIDSTELVVKALPVFHWGEDDFIFEVPVSFRAGCVGCAESEDEESPNDDFNIVGNLRLKGSGNYGNAIYFGDASYCYLKEETDDVLTVKASGLNLNAPVNLNGQPLSYGTWYPTLQKTDAVTSYTNNEGWYQRVGNVVTVGFFIKATCNSGHEATAIAISGLPFTPRTTASGGGMCSGAYVSAGFNFQCWAAAVGNTITARVQACNNTSNKNLATSASGAFYPKDGGEMTLSGTITYMVS